eukprot:3848352-Rhodomonas_salina.1
MPCFGNTGSMLVRARGTWRRHSPSLWVVSCIKERGFVMNAHNLQELRQGNSVEADAIVAAATEGSEGRHADGLERIGR